MLSPKVALITGITGQDGSYLAELLLEEGYQVHGIVRRVASEDPNHRLWRIRHILDKITLHGASLESYPSLFQVVNQVRPDEIYHLAAQSFVSYSFEDEFSTLNTNINGTHYMLAAMRLAAPEARFYFAGSSEMFGEVAESPQTEKTPFHPRSPYGISKVAGFDLTRNYREAYGIHASSGILFNHESPRRGFEFVTRKITSHVAKIKMGLAHELRLGNLDAKRDWGHAREYVRAMWLMLQQERPDDYVISTGSTHTVREFLEIAFGYVGLDYRKYVVVDERFYRPAEVNLLLGDCTKAERALGWSYSQSLQELVEEMVETDLADAQKATPPIEAQKSRLIWLECRQTGFEIVLPMLADRQLILAGDALRLVVSASWLPQDTDSAWLESIGHGEPVNSGPHGLRRADHAIPKLFLHREFGVCDSWHDIANCCWS